METSDYRPLGTTEKLFWLLDQTSQVHFVIAAEVNGIINPSDPRNELSLIQLRHPLLAITTGSISSGVLTFSSN